MSKPFYLNPPFEPNTYYWAQYEGRCEIVLCTSKGDGFYMHGREGVYPFSEVKVTRLVMLPCSEITQIPGRP